MNKRLKIVISISISSALFIGVFLIFFIQSSLNRDCGNNILAGGNSQLGGQFKLTDLNGHTVKSEDFIEKPAIIYFGYSYCPDVCPFDLQRNVLAVDILHDNGIDILPIFITIDPDRDTPQRLKEFSTFVHPKLYALTGSTDEIKQVMKIFKVYGKKSDETSIDKTNYLMDHSAFTYLVDSTGKFVDYFNRKVSAEEMAGKISCYFN